MSSLKTSKVLTLPKGKGQGTFNLEFNEIIKFESRLEEIRTVSPLTLPDLIVDISIALNVASSFIGQVELELKESERELEKAEAIALLDKVEDLLKAKNIKSSADTRKAQVILDEDVQRFKERVDILKAASIFLEEIGRAHV